MQDFAFPARRAGGALHDEPRLLQTAAHLAFGAVGREHPSPAQGAGDTTQQFGAPQLGLFLGGEGVIVDDVVAFVAQGVAGEVGLDFVEGETGGDGHLPLPLAAVQLLEEGTAAGLYRFGVGKADGLCGIEREGFDDGVVYVPAALPGGQQGEEGVESGAEAALKEVDRFPPAGFEAGLDVDVHRFGHGSSHRVVVFVEGGQVEGGRAVVGGDGYGRFALHRLRVSGATHL